MRAAPRKVLTAAHKRAIINVMYLVFVFLNMHPKRRFLQQMFGTQSAGISPAQKANRVRLSQQDLSLAEVLHRQRCPKRRAV